MNHQGTVATISPIGFIDLETLIENTITKKRKSFIFNIGSII